MTSEGRVGFQKPPDENNDCVNRAIIALSTVLESV